jgi:hypothetical protein
MRVKTEGPRVVLTHSERVRIQRELVSIAAGTEVVVEHLQVAAARSGTAPSAWTEARIDAILDAVRQLGEQVIRTPVAGD